MQKSGLRESQSQTSVIDMSHQIILMTKHLKRSIIGHNPISLHFARAPRV